MIATSNLDPAQSGGRPPVTIGLAPFIVWALRIPAAELFATARRRAATPRAVWKTMSGPEARAGRESLFTLKLIKAVGR